jgi:hypothetical protein
MNFMKRNFQILMLLCVPLMLMFALPAFQAGAISAPEKSVDFNRDIRPILSDNCFQCHGPDEKNRMAKLRLDTKEGAFGKAGVIVPGDAAASRLIRRITATDVNAVMPPPETGRKLTAQQIALLKRWIEEGANWNEHWAYITPQRPVIPTVTNKAWVRNPIDAFILARLEKENLKPSPEADKATLLRRAHLDLTGIPPAPAEVDAFLADKSPDAYEKVVDKLLASPHYGERMAMQWLDLARYADTHGFHIDSHREMWPWRDWLIRAFNDNKPFDQFTIEQLAGDLLPGATLDQKIASGFNRNHMINFEGGAIPEEYLAEYVVDRVEATAGTWMGLTMGCARCHTHKYDPISHKEFYQFFAFFNNVSEQGLDGRDGNAKPFLQLPTAQQKTRQDELKAAIKDKENTLADKNVQPLQDAWEKNYLGKTAESPRNGLITHYEFDGSLSDLSGRYQHGRTISGDPTFGSGMVGRAVGFEGQTHLTLGNSVSFDNSDQFSLSLWLKPGVGKLEMYPLQKITDANTRRGWELVMDSSQLVGIQKRAELLTFRMISRWPESALQIRSRERLVSGEWNHIVISYDGSGKASGAKLYLNGKLHDAEILQDNLSSSIRSEAELQIGNKSLGRAYSGQLDDLRFYNRLLTENEIAHLALHHPVQNVLSGVNGKRTREEADRVRRYFLTYAAPQQFINDYAALNQLKKESTQLEKQILTTMIMSELDKPRETFILARGDYRNKTDKVTPGVPAVLPPLKAEANRQPNRLDLAKWLVSAEHPLTARVTVNRYWQMIFGHGIVKTVEDFGSQGEPPVHAELLDWLSATFRDGSVEPMNAERATMNKKTDENKDIHHSSFIVHRWDLKSLLRLIVTSATYRQASRVTPALFEKDPENRLLARGPRFRLAAELIRDHALAVSGLLHDKIGGESVLPYQPAGLWEEMAFGDGFSRQTYEQSHGRDLYRRSMYTFWKRTVPPATMSTFDAPDREKCVARRPVTNTPLQALILLNDPTYIEAARALAERSWREAGKDASARLAHAFRLATSRKPSAQELVVLRDLLAQQQARYRADKKAALELLKVGESAFDSKTDVAELAAWTMVASTILNLDETITKE